jgi:Domain of unknown function (DUF3883)
MNPDRAARRADELVHRLDDRLVLLQQEQTISPLPPIVIGGSLVVPRGLIDRLSGQAQRPADLVVARAEVERRAVAAVMRAEDELGGQARDMNDEQRNHPGYDLQSIRRTPTGTTELLFIEVKGRIEGSNTVTVSRNEMLTALNKPDQYVLALVRVSIAGHSSDEVRYLRRPFEGVTDNHFAETSRTFDWQRMWNAGTAPS